MNKVRAQVELELVVRFYRRRKVYNQYNSIPGKHKVRTTCSLLMRTKLYDLVKFLNLILGNEPNSSFKIRSSYERYINREIPF